MRDIICKTPQAASSLITRTFHDSAKNTRNKLLRFTRIIFNFRNHTRNPLSKFSRTFFDFVDRTRNAPSKFTRTIFVFENRTRKAPSKFTRTFFDFRNCTRNVSLYKFRIITPEGPLRGATITTKEKDASIGSGSRNFVGIRPRKASSI